MKKIFVLLLFILSLLGCQDPVSDPVTDSIPELVQLSGLLTVANMTMNEKYVMVMESASSTSDLIISDNSLRALGLSPGPNSYTWTVSWLGSEEGEVQYVNVNLYLSSSGLLAPTTETLEITADQEVLHLLY